MKKVKIITVSAAGIILLAMAAMFLWKNKQAGPPLLTANFIDPDKVDKISKFRSCQGHTVVPQDESESKRNMKHYVVLKPEYSGGRKTMIYSPIDGEVRSVRSEPGKGLEGEIWLGHRGSEWDISFQHLIIGEKIKEGQKVKAGQFIGYAADKGVDAVFAVGAKDVKNIDGYESPYFALESIFDHMSDAVFGEYQARGIASREDFIYSREYRDQNPCQYRPGSNEGGLNDFDHPEDWIKLHN